MSLVLRSGSKKLQLLIFAVLIVSIFATLWSTLIIFQSTRLNKQNTTSLLPLLQYAETFEREILNARIAFIYYATINKPDSLEQGWTRYHRAEDALQSLHQLTSRSNSNAQLSPRIESLDAAWASYRLRLESVLTLANKNVRSGPQFDQTVSEWAADGNTLVNAARDVAKTTATLSQLQMDETGDMLGLATWIICFNGVLCLSGSIALFLTLRQAGKSLHSTDLPYQAEAPRSARNTAVWLSSGIAIWQEFRRSRSIFCALAGMLILIVVVLGTGYSAFRDIAHLSSIQAETLASQKALLDVEALRSESLAAESDTRGYVFSGRKDLLISQDNDFRQARQTFASLVRDTEGDPQQHLPAQQMRAALDDRIQSLKNISSVRERLGSVAVLKLVAKGQHLVSKHRLQDLITAYQSAENEHVMRGTLSADRAGAASKALILFAALPAALTLTVLAVIMANLLTGSKRLQEQLVYQASHDVLTDLPNRHSLQGRFEAMIEQASLNHDCCIVFAIDLDHFKDVNDRFGHHVGDAFLKQVVVRLVDVVRQRGTLFRVGGDEFLCLTPGIRNVADAEIIAGKLVGSLSKPIELSGKLIQASASVGFAVYPEHGNNMEELTRHADAALYMAKQSGRNQFHSFYETEAEVRRRTIQESLSTGIEKKLFHLVYQPQYSRHGKLRGFEALLRLMHPELGLISPAEFIPLAERDKVLMTDIGTWALKEACFTFASWIKAGLNPGILSVNVSAAQFKEGFAGAVIHALQTSGLPGAMLELELTESTMMQNLDEATREMKLIELSQVRLAIDDFGTGFSSLHQLHHLPISTLKIDQSFIKGLELDKSTRSIVSAIVALGNALSLDVIAEGVETKSQRAILAGLGCHHYQGYFFARPLDRSSALALIVSSSQVPLVVAERTYHPKSSLVM